VTVGGAARPEEPVEPEGRPGRVFILDEISVRPGLAGAYRQAYRAEYVPGAARRGMVLEGAWQHPPVHDLEELPTTLYYLWSVAGVREWWAMRLSRNPDGSDERFDKLAWWQKSDRMTLRRKRTVLTHQPEEG
jgi:hypothetical protein